ncbi:MAG: hypothetical protein LH628_26880 [Microcoleus sp. CAN_BIN18]|nr:hypothetical protein [Microcoleus sp. CAN_BIN18]
MSKKETPFESAVETASTQTMSELRGTQEDRVISTAFVFNPRTIRVLSV